MARIPIYQMSFGQDKEGNNGLFFADEFKEYDNQSIVFTIPIPLVQNDRYEILEYFFNNTFFFPFLLDEEYLELDAEAELPELVFKIPKRDFTITFEIGINDFYDWPNQPFYLRRDLSYYFTKAYRYKYLGGNSDLIYKNDGFVTLIPSDLLEMNELYEKHKGVFVGLTPNFGGYDVFNKLQLNG